MSKVTDLLSVAVLLFGASAFVVAVTDLADQHDLEALYWLALGVAALRASTELLGTGSK